MAKIKSFFYGIKLGIKFSFLPKSVEKFHLHPLIQVFRVFGNISFIFIIGEFWSNYSLLFYIIWLVTVFQLIYIILISTIKFIYLLYLWNNKKLKVINSSLDKTVTFGLNLAICIKGICQYVIYGVAALKLLKIFLS